MRYLTKQWYQTMQDSGLGVGLRADERAAVYSEELYQQLRAEKLSQWLEDEREFCADFGEEYDEAGARQDFEECCRRELEIFRSRTPERWSFTSMENWPSGARFGSATVFGVFLLRWSPGMISRFR